jgi:hypothetical protein
LSYFAIGQLESLNRNKSPLTSPLINGEWNLRWTTSESILGTKRPSYFRPDSNKPILQVAVPLIFHEYFQCVDLFPVCLHQNIDAINLKARNLESISVLGVINFENSVQADLTVRICWLIRRYSPPD